MTQKTDDPNALVRLTSITQEQVEAERLVFELFSRFGITFLRSIDLVKAKHQSVVRQLEYWPYRTVNAKSGIAGWMIAAIETDYAAPPGFVEAAEQELEAVPAERRLNTIEACQFCDERGFIKIESRNFEGQRTMRICTHDFTIEGSLAAEREARKKSKTSTDVPKRSVFDDNSEDDKRAEGESIGS